MLKQGATETKLDGQIIKACGRYPDEFLKFGKSPADLVTHIKHLQNFVQ